MLLRILEYIFIAISIILGLALILNKVYICNIKDNIKKSEYVANIAIMFAVYIFFGIIVAIFLPTLSNKLIMLLFALSPLIIGRMATYEKEMLFSIIQFICIMLSCIFVICFS